eukprot:8502092-Ditylum_brightwellii.AAC.1
MIKDNTEKYKHLLREQNAYLVNYVDFQVGDITEEMLEQKVLESTVKENILMSPFIADIHKTTFTINKGIWTIETTMENLHKELADVKTLLEVLPDMLDAKYFNKFEDFPAL